MLEDFSTDHLWDNPLKQLESTIDILNAYRNDYINKECGFYHDKDLWWQMIQLLPSSYNQTRNVMMNYEVLANIYKSRKNHKLNEWCEFCSWIEELPYSELICGNEPNTKIYPLAIKACESMKKLSRALAKGQEED